jgi:hypothetical protein
MIKKGLNSMKIGQNLQFEVPDKCPPDCTYKNDIGDYGLSAICIRCPVLNCKIIDESKYGGPIIDPRDFRNDWAADWENFFKTGKHPELKFRMRE